MNLWTRITGRRIDATAFAILLAWPVLAGAASVPAGTEKLHVLFEKYWAEEMRQRPLLALAQGDEAAQGRFDRSLEDDWLQTQVRLLEDTARSLGEFDERTLTGSDRVSYRMLRYQVALAQRFYAGDLYSTARRLPIEQFQGLHSVFATDAAGSGALPFRTVADYERALRRADEYARWTDSAIERLREGERTGVVLPRMIVERLLPQLATHFGLPPERSEFWVPVARMPADFSDADRERLTQDYRVKIDSVVEPAFRRLYDFLKDEYLGHARASVGLAQVPGGSALYRYYVAFHTTTDLTPEAIHSLGLREVRRITAEMAGVRRALGFRGTEREFFDFVRTNAEQHFGSEAEVLPAFEAARLRILPLLGGLFAHLPRAAYEVRALPESAKASQGNGYYSAAAADGSRPGVLWINIYAPGVRDRFNVLTLSLHEGLPGHHLQTSLGQEREGLPAFRRFDETTAFVEGWGLYAESLGKEMHLYGDPWDYYGHLNYEMLRANRLVIDTGLHAQGWTVERGVRFMMRHSSMSREQATAEVERYVAYPGQALAYKVGELKIRELRDRAERALGRNFDLKGFHDAVLLEGSVPLSILEGNVEDWVQMRSGRPGSAP